MTDNLHISFPGIHQQHLRTLMYCLMALKFKIHVSAKRLCLKEVVVDFYMKSLLACMEVLSSSGFGCHLKEGNSLYCGFTFGGAWFFSRGTYITQPELLSVKLLSLR